MSAQTLSPIQDQIQRLQWLKKCAMHDADKVVELIDLETDVFHRTNTCQDATNIFLANGIVPATSGNRGGREKDDAGVSERLARIRVRRYRGNTSVLVFSYSLSPYSCTCTFFISRICPLQSSSQYDILFRDTLLLL